MIENKNCSICNASIKLIHHHLSYEPEIIVIVCWDCHMIIHRMAELIRMPQIQQEIICNWVKQYGYLWKRGNEQHRKSEYYKKYRENYDKNYQKEYRQTDKYKQQKKEYDMKRKQQRKEYDAKRYCLKKLGREPSNGSTAKRGL